MGREIGVAEASWADVPARSEFQYNPATHEQAIPVWGSDGESRCSRIELPNLSSEAKERNRSAYVESTTHLKCARGIALAC
jgi:hypothetical protein